jgi:hypothetical protein
MTCLEKKQKSAHAIYSLKAQTRTSPESVVVQETLNLSNSSNGNVLIPQISLGASLDVGDGDRVDGTFDFSRRESLSGGNHLSTDLRESQLMQLLPSPCTHVLGNGSGTVQTQKQRSLQLRLCSLDFHLRRCQRHSGPLLEGEVGKVIDGSQAVDIRQSQSELQARIAHFSVTR